MFLSFEEAASWKLPRLEGSSRPHEKRWHPGTGGGTLLAQGLAFISFWETLTLESVLLNSAAPSVVLPIQFEVFLILCFYKSLHRGWLIIHAYPFTLSHLEPQLVRDRRVSLQFHSCGENVLLRYSDQAIFWFWGKQTVFLDLLSAGHGNVLENHLSSLMI